MTAPEPTPLAGGVVACHYCPDTHLATYRCRNEYGEHVWTVVCGQYVDRYTSEAVRPIESRIDR